MITYLKHQLPLFSSDVHIPIVIHLKFMALLFGHPDIFNPPTGDWISFVQVNLLKGIDNKTDIT